MNQVPRERNILSFLVASEPIFTKTEKLGLNFDHVIHFEGILSWNRWNPLSKLDNIFPSLNDVFIATINTKTRFMDLTNGKFTFFQKEKDMKFNLFEKIE